MFLFFAVMTFVMSAGFVKQPLEMFGAITGLVVTIQGCPVVISWRLGALVLTHVRSTWPLLAVPVILV